MVHHAYTFLWYSCFAVGFGWEGLKKTFGLKERHLNLAGFSPKKNSSGV
jgi:hypothetical protein